MVGEFLEKGWLVFPAEQEVADWGVIARKAALERVADPAERAKWLQCEGTWFVGVDTLRNDSTGAVARARPLSGAAYEAARGMYGTLPLHRGQVSVIYPGYPRPRTGENDAGFRYRRNRDAAHVDGILAVGPDRRRMLHERHAYILGLPLNETSADASPLVVWQGSHLIMREMFETLLRDIPESDWASTDMTGAYQATRRRVFETCPRVTVPARPGEAYLVHRMALHGVAPWGTGATAPAEGRMIAYFRPQLSAGDDAWLSLP